MGGGEQMLWEVPGWEGVPFPCLEGRTRNSDLTGTWGLCLGMSVRGRLLGRARLFPENAGFARSLRMHDHLQVKELGTFFLPWGDNKYIRAVLGNKAGVTKYLPNRVARVTTVFTATMLHIIER